MQCAVYFRSSLQWRVVYMFLVRNRKASWPERKASITKSTILTHASLLYHTFTEAVRGLQDLASVPWMNKLPCCSDSHGEERRRILLGCLQMQGFCTSQALECTSSLLVNSATPPWWRAQVLGQTLLLSMKTSKQGSILFSLLLNKQWQFQPEFSALHS